MAPSVNIARKVQTAAEFKRIVVDPDYAELQTKPVRPEALLPLSPRTVPSSRLDLQSVQGAPNWPHKTLTDYQIFLEQQCSSFGYIRDLANAVKHAELDRPSTQMIGLANTELSGPAFQPGAFQNIPFEPAADAAMTM